MSACVWSVNCERWLLRVCVQTKRMRAGKYLRMCSPGELTERLEVRLSWQQAGGRSCLVVRLRDARESVPSPMNGCVCVCAEGWVWGSR